jgi:hypothetical protein
MRWLLLILLCASPLAAQSIDRERSGFASGQNGRSGCFAPYRAVVKDVGGLDSVRVTSSFGTVQLSREVATEGRPEVRVLLPVFVGTGAAVSVGADVHEPALPMRRFEADYERSYVAVFSPDPVAARYILPDDPSLVMADHYDLSEFFTDWRLLDGYDAVVIFNPGDARLPAGSQRAIAEFCSLGGAILIAGSFRLGEQAQGLPAPADPMLHSFRGVGAQRFGYGWGAIYRVGWDDLRRSRSAQLAISDALLHHAWFGADRVPGGKRQTRADAGRAPVAPPLPLEAAAPGPMFWGLAAGLLLLCGFAPAVIGRLTRRLWPAQLVLLAGCAAIGAAATMQERPLPVIETSVVVFDGEGAAASARVYVRAMDGWRNALHVNLDDPAARYLPRPMSSGPEERCWLLDVPLLATVVPEGESVLMEGGMIGSSTYRVLAARAHRGETGFSTDDAWLLDDWLESNAYRGRRATLTPLEWPDTGIRFDDAKVLRRGAIGVTRQVAR